MLLSSSVSKTTKHHHITITSSKFSRGSDFFHTVFFNMWVCVCVCAFFSKVFKIPSLAAWMGISPPAPRVAPELVLQSSTLHHRPGPRNNTPHPQETRRVDEAAAKVPPKFGGARNWKKSLLYISFLSSFHHGKLSLFLLTFFLLHL